MRRERSRVGHRTLPPPCQAVGEQTISAWAAHPASATRDGRLPLLHCPVARQLQRHVRQHVAGLPECCAKTHLEFIACKVATGVALRSFNEACEREQTTGTTLDFGAQLLVVPRGERASRAGTATACATSHVPGGLDVDATWSPPNASANLRANHIKCERSELPKLGRQVQRALAGWRYEIDGLNPRCECGVCTDGIKRKQATCLMGAHASFCSFMVIIAP